MDAEEDCQNEDWNEKHILPWAFEEFDAVCVPKEKLASIRAQPSGRRRPTEGKNNVKIQKMGIKLSTINQAGNKKAFKHQNMALDKGLLVRIT